MDVEVTGGDAFDVSENPVEAAMQEDGLLVDEKLKTNPIYADGYRLDKMQEEHKTKSAAIRHLASKGYAVKHISVFLGIRYQHVRNVLTNPLKGRSAVVTKDVNAVGLPSVKSDV